MLVGWSRGRSFGQSVGRSVFAFLLLPNRPGPHYHVSGLVFFWLLVSSFLSYLSFKHYYPFLDHFSREELMKFTAYLSSFWVATPKGLMLSYRVVPRSNGPAFKGIPP